MLIRRSRVAARVFLSRRVSLHCRRGAFPSSLHSLLAHISSHSRGIDQHPYALLPIRSPCTSGIRTNYNQSTDLHTVG